MQKNQNEILKIQVDTLTKRFKTMKDFFNFLYSAEFSRTEIMIVDSITKKMPLDNLHNTLLFKKEQFDKMLQNLTQKLKLINNSNKIQ